MKKRVIGFLLILAGLCPLIVPVLLGLYRMHIEHWRLGDFLILYSYLYWWTYLLGILLIVLGIFAVRRRKTT